MKALSDYFRLKEFDRIEKEKKCLIALKKVIDICLKKGFHFSVNPEVYNINVSTDSYKTSSLSAYFKGDLIEYSDGSTITIYEMLEVLKKF